MTAVPMPAGVRLSPDVPDWTKLAIADAVILFGRIEQKGIEIAWVLLDADLKKKIKLTRNPATDNFLLALNLVKEAAGGANLDALESGFKMLADERNLMVHGSWNMADEKPWVVWHKFLEDEESIIGEWFERWRFERFMIKGQAIISMLERFHVMLSQP